MANMLKFEDFGSIYDEMRYESSTAVAHEVEDEKIKASVSWLNFSQAKWVFYCSKMDTANVPQHTFSNIKLLLLPYTEENELILGSACVYGGKWTHETLGASTAMYTCLEASATPTDSPFILKDEDEEVHCLGFGLYTETRTRKKTYRVSICEMVLLDSKTNAVYSMKNMKFEGNFTCKNGETKDDTA